MCKIPTTCQNRMCLLYFLLLVVDKCGTSCHHPATRLMRSTDSQHIVPTSPTSSALNKLLISWWRPVCSNLLRAASISLVGTTYSKSATVTIPATRWQQLAPNLAHQLGISNLKQNILSTTFFQVLWFSQFLWCAGDFYVSGIVCPIYLYVIT